MRAAVAGDNVELPSEDLSPVGIGTAFPLGDFELLEELGRGGMAIVYRARQKSVARIVALKLLHPGRMLSADEVERFQREAEIVARLEHPHIVPLYDAGEDRGQPWCAMKFVPGGSLAERISEFRSAPDRRLRFAAMAELVRNVALAIHHAHQRGVLHRDLKPSNILLDQEGLPMVTDFGLSRALDCDSALTHTGAFIGSPAYTAPEQAASDGQDITVAADIYGVGAILYELLGGRPPFSGETPLETLRQVVEAPPIAPHLTDSSIPADLETICLKCLEKDPAKRYGTAQELSEDLSRFLRGEPTLARPIGPVGKVWRWYRRKPVIAGLVMALNVALALGVAGILWQWRRALSSELAAREQNYVSDMNLVQQLWDDGDLNRAQDLLRGYIPDQGQSDLRGFEWRYLWHLCRDESHFAFTNFSDAVTIVPSPGGAFVAASSGRTVKFLDYATGRELGTLRNLRPANSITALAFSSGLTNLLAVASDNTIQLWDLEHNQITTTLDEGANVKRLALSTDGKLIAAANDDQTVTLWDIERRIILWTAKTVDSVAAVAFTPDGKSLISGGGEIGNTLLWELTSGKATAFPLEHTAWVTSIAFSPDGKTLATAANDNTVVLWDLAERKLLKRLLGHNAYVNSVQFSSDGSRLVTGSGDSTIRLWDIATGTTISTYRGHQAGVTSAVLSPDARHIVSSSWDRTVKVWDTLQRGPADVIPGRSAWLNAVEFSPDGKFLAASASRGNMVQLWDLSSHSPITELKGFTASPVQSLFSQDGSFLAVGGEDETVRIWNLKDFGLRCVLTNEFDASSISLSPDGPILAVAVGGFKSGTVTNGLTFWDLSSSRKLEKLAAARPKAHIVAFSPDGRLLAVGYFDGCVRLWDFHNEALLAEFNEHWGEDNYVWSVAFNPSGTILASADNVGNVCFYDVRRRTALPSSKEHSLRVWRVTFSPDGQRLASASDDGTIKLWNVETRRSALTLKGHLGAVAWVCFSPDSKLMASCGADGAIRLWHAPPLNEVSGRMNH
jgi:WD40 repeat protein/serine/threonine protein kinase